MGQILALFAEGALWGYVAKRNPYVYTWMKYAVVSILCFLTLWTLYFSS